MIFPFAAFVNAIAIMAGTLLGVSFGAHLPEKVRAIVFQGLGLCVTVIGLSMALKVQYPLILIFSILIGSIIGQLLNIEEWLMKGGDAIKKRFRSKNPLFTDGLVNASVLFCIGAMAILGSFDEGLRGDRSITYAKSILDAFAAMALASVYGIGVIFSALAVFIYQGTLTVFASSLQHLLTEPIMNELTATGGVLILGIGINLLEIKQIPLSNMVLSLFLSVIFSSIFI